MADVHVLDDGPSHDETGLAVVIERLAARPEIDVLKLEKIIELQERLVQHQAKAAFDAAFAQMQPDLPEIGEKGQIFVKGQLRSTYARLEDIHRAIKPVLKMHGFSIRHRTEWPEKDGMIRIVGILSHTHGHREESAFEAPMDKSEYRTDIQSMGSTVSYGRRYTTIDLLNLTTCGHDDDGATSGRPTPPEGYETWLGHWLNAADKGLALLQAGWASAPADFKNFAIRYDKAKFAAAKAQARQVDEKANT